LKGTSELAFKAEIQQLERLGKALPREQQN
jgi:hypothetical protein